MNLKRCVRKGEAEYSTLSCCFFFYLLFVVFAFSANVYNLKAHTSFNASREFFLCGPGRAGEWRWYTYNQIAEQQTNDGWRKTLSSILFCQKKCGRKRGNTHTLTLTSYMYTSELPNANGNAKSSRKIARKCGSYNIFYVHEHWTVDVLSCRCALYNVHVVGIFILPMWAMTCIVYYTLTHHLDIHRRQSQTL